MKDKTQLNSLLQKQLPKRPNVTWLEALADKRTLAPVRFFTKLYDLAISEYGGSTSIPEEITKYPFFTGTFVVVPPDGKPLGKVVECKCSFNGSQKTVLFEPGKYAPLVDTLLLCNDNKERTGAPSILLLNASNYKQITTEEEMFNAREILVRFNGSVYAFEFKDVGREGVDVPKYMNARLLRSAGNDGTTIWAYNNAALGLMVLDFMYSLNLNLGIGEFYRGLSTRPHPNGGKASEYGTAIYYDPKIAEETLNNCKELAMIEKSEREATRNAPKLSNLRSVHPSEFTDIMLIVEDLSTDITSIPVSEN